MPLEFTSEKKTPKVLTFTLDGRDYVFTVPKKAYSTLAIIEGRGGHVLNFDWLGAGLSEADQKRIVARLKDPNDDFDVDDLKKVVEGLIEESSGRPTTPLPDSGQRLDTSGKLSTGKPRKRASTR